MSLLRALGLIWLLALASSGGLLLAFSRDLRVVLLRLASRLQTLRYHALSKTPPTHEAAKESLEVFAALDRADLLAGFDRVPLRPPAA